MRGKAVSRKVIKGTFRFVRPAKIQINLRICVTVAKYINELGALAVTCQRKVVGLNPIAVDKSLRP